MIVTLTMNPALDRTYYVDHLQPGSLHRPDQVEEDAGGKGINVSRTLQILGKESVVVGVLAGHTGHRIEEQLKSLGLQTDFLFLPEGETRINTKIVESDGTLTELNEKGPEVKAGTLNEVAGVLKKYASPDTVYVLSGSVPEGAPDGYYRYLTAALHSVGGRVLLDADGPLLSEGIGGYPDIIKPNIRELVACYAAAGEMENGAPDQQHLVRFARSIISKAKDGNGFACISLGDKGALFVNGEKTLFSRALPVPVKSTVGAGDAMVAAIAACQEEGKTMEYCARLAVACATAACTTAGTRPADMTSIQSYLQGVKLQEI